MRVLFCVADIFLGEPHGVLQLASIARQAGHEVKLFPLKRKNLSEVLPQWTPDVVAYSAMSPEIPLFKKADAQVRAWAEGRRVLRVMGGAHSTYFPEILEELRLDAVCIGEGDRAFPDLLERFANNKPLSGAPNCMVQGQTMKDVKKELISELDELPFIDRELFYEVAPSYRLVAMRGFMTGRGCPYRCSYCHNHAFNEIFKGCGKIVRRRSVDRVIAEMKQVLKRDPHVRLIKISDDTFAHSVDEWLMAFLSRYKSEIKLPFYCLMRSNTLTDDMARRLKEAGCVAVGMSVESGDERIRNEILQRGLTNKMVIDSFANARKHGLKTFGNTLLALPGAKFSDDLKSFCFTKRLRLTVPTFGIFSPYPKTQLYDYALDHGCLPAGFEFTCHAGMESALETFTKSEKRRQLNLVYMGTLFCDLPDFFMPVAMFMLRIPMGLLYKTIGTSYLILKTALFIFPNSYPRNLRYLWQLFWQAIHYFTATKKD